MIKKVILFAILLLGSFAVSVSAQSKVQVRFAKGASSATIKGTVSGYKYIDYIVRAKSGQTMTVNLTSANAACNFAIFYSDMKEIEDANGVQESTRNVDVDDDYIVRVLLPRSAARRKESATFSLKIAITN